MIPKPRQAIAAAFYIVRTNAVAFRLRMMSNCRLLTGGVARACALLLLALTSQPAALAGPAPIPVRDFFRTPAATSPRLSPSGHKIALLVPDERGRLTLAVADIATPNRLVGIARFADADIRSFGWINE